MILAQFLAQSITRVPLNWGTVGFRFQFFIQFASEHFRFPFFDAHHARGKFFRALEAE